MKSTHRSKAALFTILAGLLAAPAISTAAEYTTDTDWGGADLTLQDGDVIAGVHSNIGHFVVAEGATVTVKPFTDGPAYGRVHVLADSVSIAGNLSADAAGYPEEEGDGAGTGRCAAGYGGRGGIGGVSGRGGDTYGSPEAPNRLGSGGGNGSSSHVAGSGGGAVLLEATGTITVAGTISANGGDGEYRCGGGSGGSIWLQAQTVAGTGSVIADGGEGGTAAADGGGGRIAFSTPDNQFSGLIRAHGPGSGGRRARSGTFNFQSDPTADLVIGADIALPPGTNWVFRSLTVPDGVILEVQSESGSAPEFTNDVPSRLTVLQDLTIENGGHLSADGTGYFHEQGEGVGSGRSGAGYGGRGGDGFTVGDYPGGEPYGDPTTPNRLGSGGTGGSYHGGSGGGGLLLEIGGVLTVDGTLSANGGAGGYRSGGGSGGSIWVKAPTIKGTGDISADGGFGPSAERAGGGGGGRILLEYGYLPRFETNPGAATSVLNTSQLPDNLAFSGIVTVNGGSGATDRDGEPGSILFRYMPVPQQGTIILLR